MQLPKSPLFRVRRRWLKAMAVFGLGVLCAALSVQALYEITSEGAWPKDWPRELEPLRKQSRTLDHQALSLHEIPFTSRAEFEAAWPHIVRLKSHGAPLTLSASPDNQYGGAMKAGVRIFSPLTGTLVTTNGTRYPAGAETSVPGKFLKIGPPWPDDIKSKTGELPEYVVERNGRWVPYIQRESGERYVRRARTDIELIVDGKIVDLNRIVLPADTPLIDKRFTGAQKTSKSGKAK